jgi:hypothetical protein
MFPPAEATRSVSRRRSLSYVGLALLVLALLVAAFYASAFVHLVPPISAKVVDAITGKPVPGINVCLQVDGKGLGGREVLRSEMSRTNDAGKLFFRSSVHVMRLLRKWDGYWIRVLDPNEGIGSRCGADIGQSELNKTEQWPVYLGPDANGRPKYFPVALWRGDPDPSAFHWGAMRRAMGFPLGQRIALIPILQNVNDCKLIHDPPLSEDCRQLNTYAAALSLRENQDAESRARAATLCGEVDHAFFSAWCRGNLAEFAMLQTARQSRGDYFLTAGVPERRPDDLFPAVVVGVPRISSSMYDDGSRGTGRRAYTCTYLRQGDTPAYVDASIEEFPDLERARERLGELPGGFLDQAPGTDSEVQFAPGQKIERHRGAQYSGAFWLSNNRVVFIRFNQPFAKEDEFIATYLVSFPSSL